MRVWGIAALCGALGSCGAGKTTKADGKACAAAGMMFATHHGKYLP
jgi:hypothetical protein